MPPGFEGAPPSLNDDRPCFVIFLGCPSCFKPFSHFLLCTGPRKELTRDELAQQLQAPLPWGRQELPRPPAEGRKGPQFTEVPGPQGYETTVSKLPVTLSLKWGAAPRGGHTGPEAQPGGSPPGPTLCGLRAGAERGASRLAADPLPPSPTTERAGSDPGQPPLPELMTVQEGDPWLPGRAGLPGSAAEDIRRCRVQPGWTRQRVARFSSLETVGCGQPHPGHPGPLPATRGLPEGWTPSLPTSAGSTGRPGGPIPGPPLSTGQAPGDHSGPIGLSAEGP